jgi:hypothetical protein
MPNYLHRTTKQYLQSISPNDPRILGNEADYIFMPDLSAVEGVPNIYWTITGDVVSEMSQAEKDVVDAAILSDARDAAIQAEIDELESVTRQVVVAMVRELNILRALHGLPDRTLAQVKTQLRNDLGT